MLRLFSKGRISFRICRNSREDGRNIRQSVSSRLACITGNRISRGGRGNSRRGTGISRRGSGSKLFRNYISIIFIYINNYIYIYIHIIFLV